MIKNILELLKVVDGETETIRIAQGKYKLAETFKEGFKQIKREIKWHKKIEVQLEIESAKASKNLDDLSKGISNLNKEVKKSNKDTTEGMKEVEKSSEDTAGGVKKIGSALKAAGIGLIIAAFAKFTEVLNENQKVADFFSITFETLSLAFNDFFNFILSNTGSITGFFKAIFDDPLKSIEGLGSAIKNNIIERFNSMLDTVGLAGKAVKKILSRRFFRCGRSSKRSK